MTKVYHWEIKRSGSGLVIFGTEYTPLGSVYTFKKIKVTGITAVETVGDSVIAYRNGVRAAWLVIGNYDRTL